MTLTHNVFLYTWALAHIFHISNNIILYPEYRTLLVLLITILNGYIYCATQSNYVLSILQLFDYACSIKKDLPSNWITYLLALQIISYNDNDMFRLIYIVEFCKASYGNNFGSICYYYIVSCLYAWGFVFVINLFGSKIDNDTEIINHVDSVLLSVMGLYIFTCSVLGPNSVLTYH